jgi:DNA polymerase sigma
MREVLRRVAPPTDKIKRELAFVSMLKRLVKELLGSQADISPYGSAAAGFGTIDSDLDLQLALGKGWEARVRLHPRA